MNLPVSARKAYTTKVILKMEPPPPGPISHKVTGVPSDKQLSEPPSHLDTKCPFV